MEQLQRLNDMENQVSLPVESSDKSDFEHSDSDEEVENDDESDSKHSNNSEEEIENDDESGSDHSNNSDEEIESDDDHSDSYEDIESSDDSDSEHSGSDEEIGSTDESDFEISDDDEESENSDESDCEPSDDDEETEDLSKDESAPKFFDEIDWTDEVKNELLATNEEFIFDAGPVHDLPVGSTPLQFLQLFFTTDFCEMVRVNINKFAELEQERKKAIDEHWKPIDNITELWRFFCIIIYSGLIRVPRFNDYWSKNGMTEVPAVKKLMSRKRFQKILHYFCMADIHNNENFDFTRAVKPIIEDIKARYLKHFKLTRELTMSKVLMKNKESSVVFKRKFSKKSKTGLKIWTLSSPNKYVFDFDISTGKIPKNERSKNRLRYDVASRLLVSVKSSGYHIYLDRFFSSVSLMIDLFEKGHRACGCIRIGKKRTPKELKALKLKELDDYQHFQCIQHPEVLCCACGYRNKLCIISTNSRMESVEVKMKERSKTVTAQFPSAIAKYQTHMKKVKISLPSQDYYNRLKKSSKQWRHLFWFLLESSMKNAYVVYTSTNTPRNQKSKGFPYFKLDIIEGIFSHCNVGIPSCSTNSPAPSESPSEEEPGPSTSPTLTHQRVKIEGKRQACERCSKLKRESAANYHVPSSYMCNTCQISLCVSCFDVYHSENCCGAVSLEDQ